LKNRAVEPSFEKKKKKKKEKIEPSSQEIIQNQMTTGAFPNKHVLAFSISLSLQRRRKW